MFEVVDGEALLRETSRDDAATVSSYHVNLIKPGLSAMGRKKCPKINVPSGQIEMNRLIRHSGGTKRAITIIIAVHKMQKMNVTLNFLMIFGTSSKKVVFSTSLAVAPQLMSTLNMCERMAWETCREMPPRKTVRSGIQLMFSPRAFRKPFSPMR